MSRNYALGSTVITVKGGPIETYDVLRRLYDRDGALTKKAVVKEARRLHKKLGDASPLDPYFSWDVDIGMQKLHEIEAGELIRVYRLVFDESEGVRAFVSVEAGDSREYRHAEDVAATPMFSDAYKESIRRRLEALANELERWGLWEPISRTIRKNLAV